MLNITTNPNPILRKKSAKIADQEIKSPAFQKLCVDMIKTMKKNDGVGLAAPQIGLNIRLICIQTKGGPVCMVNPVITKRSWAKEWEDEGCLSVPEFFGEVKRHKAVTCSFTDIKGKPQKTQAKGLMARVIQHETDHLDGILFIDKAKNIQKLEAEK